MSRVSKKVSKKISNFEKLTSISVLLIFFSTFLYFINSNFKFLLYISIVVSCATINYGFISDTYIKDSKDKLLE